MGRRAEGGVGGAVGHPRAAVIPRDRWVGVSPGGNVTPGGKLLEALDEIQALRRQRAVTVQDVEAIFAAVHLDEAACWGRVEPLALSRRLAD